MRKIVSLRGVVPERVVLSTSLDPYMPLKALAQYSGPAVDLKSYLGKRRKAQPAELPCFTEQEGAVLVRAAQEVVPRWAPFVMTSLLAGLRWGEVAGLFKQDIDWRRNRIHVQRTVSRGGRLERPKDSDSRHVVMSPALREALKAHLEAMTLEGQVQRWDEDARRLVFPTPEGRLLGADFFRRTVWGKLLKAAGLPYRRYHSTRHSFATWLLDSGADVRFVQAQLGHASIQQTVGTYSHLVPEKHEHTVRALDKLIG